MARTSQHAANVAYYRRNREAEIARVRRRQEASVAYLRQLRLRPCTDCGLSFEPHQMDFDHLEASLKSFRLTEGRAMLKHPRALREEADKCEVVCANCHRIRTQRRQLDRGTRLAGSSRYLERKRAGWRAQAQLLDQLRDVPCADCGGRFPACAMDFDHREPADKRHTVTRMVGRSGTARILDEVAKCDIVCANCHRLRTFLRR